MIDRIQYLHTLLESTPDDVFLHYALGLEFIKKNDVPKAISKFETCISIDANYVATYYQLGKAYEANNDITNAINTYKSGVEVATAAKDNHTLSELNGAWMTIDEDF